MPQSLSSIFQSYIEQLQPASQSDKQYSLVQWLNFLMERYGQDRVQVLMDSGDPDAWALLSRENLEAFVSWLANRNFAPRTIEAYSRGIRSVCQIAMTSGCVSAQEWQRLKAMNMSEIVRKCVGERKLPQRLSTDKERYVSLSDAPVDMLKPVDRAESEGLNVSAQTLAVASTEMQARFAELLYAEPPKIVQVTFRGEPVAVVLSQSLYLAFQEKLSADGESERGPVYEATVMSMTQARNLFYSFSKRLAPLLSEEEYPVKVIEVTSHQKPVGAVLSWAQWIRYLGDQFSEAPHILEVSATEDRTFTIATARHRLFLFAEQFAHEEQQEIYKPVFITNSRRPVFAIVPWKWYQLVSTLFHPQDGNISDDK